MLNAFVVLVVGTSIITAMKTLMFFTIDKILVITNLIFSQPFDVVFILNNGVCSTTTFQNFPSLDALVVDLNDVQEGFENLLMGQSCKHIRTT